MTTIGDPRIGIALGGGSARGLAHIAFIEAMDELGLVPAAIAGTSIGALLGAGWASGLSGRDIRQIAYDMLGSMNGLLGRVVALQMPSVRHLFSEGLSLQIDPLRVVEAVLPSSMPQRIEDLSIPFSSVAADFKAWHQVVFTAGPLHPAVAGSLAIPSVFKPVAYNDTLLIDGGVVNPLPLDVAAPGSDILIGIDVNGEPGEWPRAMLPSPLDIGLGATQIMMHQLTAHMMAAYPPDLYVRPHLHAIGLHEFWRVREIIAAGEASKERFKRQLSQRVEGFIAARQRTV